MSETLVTVQLRFEDLDRTEVASRIGGLTVEAIGAEAEHTSISVRDYEADPVAEALVDGRRPLS